MAYSSNEAVRIKSLTANYTVVRTDDYLFCDTSGGGFTITLLNSGDPTQITIKKITAAPTVLTIDGNGATIDGSSTLEIADIYVSVTIIWDGTNFHIT